MNKKCFICNLLVSFYSYLYLYVLNIYLLIGFEKEMIFLILEMKLVLVFVFVVGNVMLGVLGDVFCIVLRGCLSFCNIEFLMD